MLQPEGRRDQRTKRKFKVWLSIGGEPMFAELASTENISPWGFRVRTRLSWRPGSHIFVKRSKAADWIRARVAYCQALHGESHALGLEFYGNALRYTLTFRCPHCGRCEASANLRSDQFQPGQRMEAQVYRVHCSGCGWRGEVSGFSPVRILRYQSKEMYTPEERTLLAGTSRKPSFRMIKRAISGGLL